MGKILIEGKKVLRGTVKISGAKNSAVSLLPAALLSDEKVIINNIPNISDVDALIEIIEYLNVDVIKNDDMVIIDPTNIENKEIPEDISKKLRASYYFMSALLGKYKKVEMYFPGGCNIGKRPIDQTLKAFRLLGAKVEEKDNKYNIVANKLEGAVIELDMPSVGATVNAIMVAVKATGETIIKNAAREPEIGNLIDFLNKMGAKITGKDSSEIHIEGVNHLYGCTIDVIPDRIEAGTYVIIGALAGNNLKIDNIIPSNIRSLLDLFDEMGIKYIENKNSIVISKCENMKPVKVETKGYPGFPTDLQQPLTALLTQCNGESYLTETIYENRFQNVEYLNLMNSQIEINDRTIKINGPSRLIGKEVLATDLRAGACMVIAGLIADGETIIDDIEHVLRGYEDIISKLEAIGAKIRKI